MLAQIRKPTQPCGLWAFPTSGSRARWRGWRSTSRRRARDSRYVRPPCSGTSRCYPSASVSARGTTSGRSRKAGCPPEPQDIFADRVAQDLSRRMRWRTALGSHRMCRRRDRRTCRSWIPHERVDMPVPFLPPDQFLLWRGNDGLAGFNAVIELLQRAPAVPALAKTLVLEPQLHVVSQGDQWRVPSL